ncbi:hypothetical protein WA158_007243 [Blastocystis sp. Blastoise]
MDSEVCQKAIALYKKHFNEEPETAVMAPGRVNLIGEHTDYNDGFVCPLAIHLATCIVGKKLDSNKCIVISGALGEDMKAEFNGDDSLAPSEKVEWYEYVKGVVAQYIKEFNLPQVGFQVACFSNVPLGGGLSSSASLEVAIGTFIEEIFGLEHDGKKRALLSQEAEHEYAHVPCGIMDQFISSCGEKDHALLIDCRSKETELVPLTNPDVSIVVTNSNCKHSLTGSEYPERVAACKKAVEIIKGKYPEVIALRDVTIEMLDEVKDQLDEVTYRRALHSITEDIRTKKCVECLKNNDYEGAGQYLYQSHESLKDNYEVTTEELDILVELAKQVPGVFGARMTGGGFGGCTITLVKKSAEEALINQLKKGYKEATGKDCTIFATRPSQGAHVISLTSTPAPAAVAPKTEVAPKCENCTVCKCSCCPFKWLSKVSKNIFGCRFALPVTLLVAAGWTAYYFISKKKN